MTLTLLILILILSYFIIAGVVFYAVEKILNEEGTELTGLIAKYWILYFLAMVGYWLIAYPIHRLFRRR